MMEPTRACVVSFTTVRVMKIAAAAIPATAEMAAQTIISPLAFLFSGVNAALEEAAEELPEPPEDSPDALPEDPSDEPPEDPPPDDPLPEETSDGPPELKSSAWG